jgi:multisubunit Na+/H+ antiporter MnhB subunit
MLGLSLLSEGGAGPDTSLTALLLIGIAFFFLIITVGWLSSNSKGRHE